MIASPYRRTGFATLEVITATFILSMAGFGTFQLFNVGMGHHRVSQERLIAHRALSNEWERLKSIPLAQLSNEDEHAFSLEMPELETLHQPSTQIHVRPHDDTKAYDITLEITWRGFTGRSMTEDLTTLRAF